MLIVSYSGIRGLVGSDLDAEVAENPAPDAAEDIVEHTHPVTADTPNPVED